MKLTIRRAQKLENGTLFEGYHVILINDKDEITDKYITTKQVRGEQALIDCIIYNLEENLNKTIDWTDLIQVVRGTRLEWKGKDYTYNSFDEYEEAGWEVSALNNYIWYLPEYEEWENN